MTAGQIDAAWEERILPTLSEYTRIPCLSPAFDADWAARGALVQAAELLRDWVAAQDSACAIASLRRLIPAVLVSESASTSRSMRVT